jgi:REP element-mobilizing transposase RayT
MPGLYQSITYRLADSLPQSVIGRVHEAASRGSERFFDELDTWLDRGSGKCWLRDPQIAGIVEQGFLHFDGDRYKLLHWVVMPNHVHVMIAVTPGFELAKTVKSWKAFTGARANAVLGRTGQFWMPDYHDRVIRDEWHYYDCAAYIENNPVKAGLVKNPEAWRFGSAYARTVKLENAGGLRV